MLCLAHYGANLIFEKLATDPDIATYVEGRTSGLRNAESTESGDWEQSRRIVLCGLLLLKQVPNKESAR